MGKNRKTRNVVDPIQLQKYSNLENSNQEVHENFHTADDFDVAHEKSISSDGQNLTPQSNCDKHFTEGNNCHINFWTSKFNASVTDSATSVASDDSIFQSPQKIPENISEDSDFYSGDTRQSKRNIVLEFNSDTTTEENTEIFRKLLKSGDESVNEVLESVLPLNEGIIAEKNICCTKKKSKKKVFRNKSIDEEVEKLLKELESDKEEFSSEHTLSSTVICATDNGFSKTSQLFKNNDCDNNVDTLVNIAFNAVENLKLKDGEMESKVIDTMRDLADDMKSINSQNLELDAAKELASIAEKNETIKSACQRKRAKKLKAKQKKIENECKEKTEESELKLKELSEVQKVEVAEGGNSAVKFKHTEDSDKRDKKRPSKKQLVMIHEALKKAKEEEERLKKEEEAKRKIAEEAERIRLEKLKLEQEKKEKKKLKEKQRREKMKAEGRLLSKSQKQSRARMEATLAVLRQQGIDVPQISDKKPNSTHGPRLGNCKNFHRKRLDSCQSTQSTDSAVVISERQKTESFSSQESSGKDSSSDLPSSFDSNDDLPIALESDKGNFSCSEESDALDDNVMCQNISKEITYMKFKTMAEKSNQRKREAFIPQTKSSECDFKINPVKFRSPVVCVLGHVDTGKTKILDYIRKTHVQDSEAGGITQQIGATMIPQDALKEKCKMVEKFSLFDMKIPGLLVIDTPGHESFSNLRSRGSSICDIAVLVVDIMHGLEPQTIESINLLKKGKTPFVVALNKIDRIYGWKSYKEEDIENTIKNQSQITQMEFKKRCQDIVLQFANQYLNATLYYENKDPRSYVSMVPTSAITGDGMGNILSIVAQLTQSLMQKRLIYSNELQATVLEVKAIPGLGTTIDVILVNGCLQEGDTIVLAGHEGPIVTQIRSLLMPQPLKELRVKNPYIEYKSIEGAQGVKITGKDLEKAIAGLPLLVARNHSMIDTLKTEINSLFRDTMNSIKISERGVYVQASTLGSLEALLNFLSSSAIPYFNVKIGPVVKKDVMKASIMLEHDALYAAILAFDVKIERDAQELADSLGVRIFHADIIYHLFDMYMEYSEDVLLKRTAEVRHLAVFPCKLKILPDFVYGLKDPIVLGVHVEDGTLKEGTPLCVPSRDVLEIGVVSSIEVGKNKVSSAKKGDEVCIKIDPKPGESPKTYGKHFTHDDLLVSRISRQSIDICKEHYRSELQSSDWHLMIELKKILHIV